MNSPSTRFAALLRDVIAGLTLASVNIPQVLGYTRIAVMPAVTGLYTVLLPPVAFALLGSSKHLVVAADSATAAILSSGLAPLAPPGSPRYMAMVSTVALLCAAFLLVARLFRLGFLADFLSRTVLIGFLAGVGLQVFLTMLPDMLGVPVQTHNALMILAGLPGSLSHLQPLPAALSATTMILVLLGQWFAPRAPMPLLVVVGAIAAGKTWHLDRHGVALTGPMTGGLPSLGLPATDWNTVLGLLPVAASCVFVIVAQSIATSRSFATSFHERLDANADILGLSAANLAAGLSGTFTVNGSPTQTAMAVRAGARSQRAQIVFALAALGTLLFLTGPLQYLPRCVLASIVAVVALNMINVRAMRAILPESPGEFQLAVVTAASVVAIGVQQGIFLAIALSLFRHVRHSYRPHSLVLIQEPGQRGLEATPAIPGMETEPGLVVYRFGADLFYANCNQFADDIRQIVDHTPHPVRCLVLDASAMTDIDYSAARMLRDLLNELRTRGIAVFFGRVSPFLRADMDRHGITAVEGAGGLHTTLHEAVDEAHALLVANPATLPAPKPVP